MPQLHRQRVQAAIVTNAPGCVMSDAVGGCVH